MNENRGAGGRQKAEANELAGDIRARYEWDTAVTRLPDFSLMTARPPLDGEKSLTLANGLMRRLLGRSNLSSFSAPFIASIRRKINGKGGHGEAEAVLPGSSGAYASPYYESRDHSGEVPPFNSAPAMAPAVSRTGRDPVRKYDVMSPRDSMKTNPDNQSWVIERNSRKGASTPASALLQLTGRAGTVYRAAPAENFRGDLPLPNDSRDGRPSSGTALAAQEAENAVDPERAETVSRTGGDRRTRQSAAGENGRVVSLLPGRQVFASRRESPLPNTADIREMRPAASAFAVQIRRVSNEKGEISGNEIRALNGLPVVNAMALSAHVDKQVVHSPRTGDNAYGDANRSGAADMRRPDIGSCAAAWLPMAVARKPVADELFRNRGGTKPETTEASAMIKRTTLPIEGEGAGRGDNSPAAEMTHFTSSSIPQVSRKGERIVMTSKETAGHASGYDPGGDNSRAGIDIAPIAVGSVSDNVRTASIILGRYVPSHDVRPFVMRKMASLAGMPFTHPLTVSSLAMGRPSFNVVQLMGGSIGQEGVPVLVRDLAKGGHSLETSISGSFRDEQKVMERASGVTVRRYPLIRHAAAWTTPGGAISASEIRPRSGDGLPPAGTERDRGPMLPYAAHGRMAEGSTIRNSLPGVLQRSPDSGNEANQADASSTAAVAGSGETGGMSGMHSQVGRDAPLNLERLADQLYAIIERRLVLEKERRGL